MTEFEIKKSIIDNIIKLFMINPSGFQDDDFIVRSYRSKSNGVLDIIHIANLQPTYKPLVVLNCIEKSITIRTPTPKIFPLEDFSELYMDMNENDETFIILKYGRDYLQLPFFENSQSFDEFKLLNDFLSECIKKEENNDRL